MYIYLVYFTQTWIHLAILYTDVHIPTLYVLYTLLYSIQMQIYLVYFTWTWIHLAILYSDVHIPSLLYIDMDTIIHLAILYTDGDIPTLYVLYTLLYSIQMYIYLLCMYFTPYYTLYRCRQLLDKHLTLCKKILIYLPFCRNIRQFCTFCKYQI